MKKTFFQEIFFFIRDCFCKKGGTFPVFLSWGYSEGMAGGVDHRSPALGAYSVLYYRLAFVILLFSLRSSTLTLEEYLLCCWGFSGVFSLGVPKRIKVFVCLCVGE